MIFEARIHSTHPYSFRPGEWATIVRVVFTSDNCDARLCYEVRFDDGVRDFWAIPDDSNYLEIKPGERA